MHAPPGAASDDLVADREQGQVELLGAEEGEGLGRLVLCYAELPVTQKKEKMHGLMFAVK